MNILHISDIHVEMNMQEDKDSLGGKIDEALNSLDEKFYPEVLLVTGDFTNTGNDVEFQNVKDLLQEFKKFDSLKNIKNYVFVPGNHDFQWELNGTILNDLQKTISYKNFLESFTDTVSKVGNSTIQKKLDKFMIQHYIKTIGTGNKAILLIGMNSMLIDSKERAG